MEGYAKARSKMKRKDLDQVNDDFSDFSLSSPARKIRRLDAELPPIIEGEAEESEIPLPYQPSSPGTHRFDSGGVVIGEMLASPSPSPSSENEERAIVLFKPVHSHVLQEHSPSGFSVSVDPDLISGFKNQLYRSDKSAFKELIEDEVGDEESSKSGGRCLAVVPWVPSQIPSAPGMDRVQTADIECMEAEEMGNDSMEIEDVDAANLVTQGQATAYAGQSGSEGFQQWQQPHCMIPQLPQSVSTPVVWYR